VVTRLAKAGRLRDPVTQCGATGVMHTISWL